MFRFKQFVIYQDKTAMKIGTDGILLGAWCDLSSATRILDIGTGTGLLSLMSAQKTPNNVLVDAIEIDNDAYIQACENVRLSKFKNRITVIHNDFILYSSDDTVPKYSHIISNPPYFEHSLKSNNHKRNLARHTDSLPFAKLIEGVSKLLSDDGHFSVIIPNISCLDFVKLCALRHLHLHRKTLIISKEGKEPIRTMLTFSPKLLPLEKSTITICDRQGNLTEKYASLCSAN